MGEWQEVGGVVTQCQEEGEEEVRGGLERVGVRGLTWQTCDPDVLSMATVVLAYLSPGTVQQSLLTALTA